VLFCSAYALAGTWTKIDMPGATNTYIYGIDGGKVVGCYTYSDGVPFGFVYDGTNWTTLRKTGANNIIAVDIDGDNILGQYTDNQGTHNAIFNGTTWTTITDGLFWTPRSISGDNIVGTYQLMSEKVGVIYNIKTATINYINLQAGWTEAYGIDGDNIVGVNITTEHYSNPHYHGFLYDGSTWTLLDAPGSTWTEAFAIDGSNIVGVYQSGTRYYTFLYDGSTWKTLDTLMNPWDMEGDKIVGSYTDASGSHGFIYTIPEPATLLLLGLGAAIVRKKARN